MKDLIGQQEEVVAKLQERLIERLAKRSPIDVVSECLSRAVEDLNTLKAQAGGQRRKATAHAG